MFLCCAPLVRIGVRANVTRKFRTPVAWGTAVRGNSTGTSNAPPNLYGQDGRHFQDNLRPSATSSAVGTSQGQRYQGGGGNYQSGGGNYQSAGGTYQSGGGNLSTQSAGLDLGPIKPRPRPSTAVLEDLRTAAEKSHVKVLPRAGQVNYYQWHYINALLNHYAAGWEGQITAQWSELGTAYIKYKLTLNCEDGSFSQECVAGVKFDTRSTADPYMVAEQNAFKRCAARFGCGLRDESF